MLAMLSKKEEEGGNAMDKAEWSSCFEDRVAVGLSTLLGAFLVATWRSLALKPDFMS